MRFEGFIAIRYLREGKAQTALVLGGTTVGVAVLIFLTALIGGLQRTLVAQTLSAQAHVFVKAPERVARPLPSPEPVADHVEKVPDRIRSIEQWQQVLASIGTHARGRGRHAHRGRRGLREPGAGHQVGDAAGDRPGELRPGHRHRPRR